MPPPADVDDAWSDSDDEMEADVETAVQLGIPDGPLLSSADILDPAVSRIGGHPVRCPFASLCTSCIDIPIHPCRLPSTGIGFHVGLSPRPRDRELQELRPANGTPHPNLVPARGEPERPLAVRVGVCQRLLSTQGREVCAGDDSPDTSGTCLADCTTRSIRAWRELRFNKKYAEKLEKQLARRKEKEAEQATAAAAAAAKKAQPKSNPFAVRTSSWKLRRPARSVHFPIARCWLWSEPLRTRVTDLWWSACPNWARRARPRGHARCAQRIPACFSPVRQRRR